MQNQITIHVTPQGEIVVQVDRVTGQTCHDLTRELERRLGTPSGTVPKFDTQILAGQGQVQR